MTAPHGSTPAAWTGVILTLLGFLTGGIGLIMGSWLVFWIGVGLVAVAIVAAKIMQLAGLGAR